VKYIFFFFTAKNLYLKVFFFIVCVIAHDEQQKVISRARKN